MKSKMKIGGVFDVVCIDANGNEKWRDRTHNLVVTEALQHVLDILFTGATQVNPWYVGLTGTAPSPAAGDTLASHAGWTEISAYTGNRQEYVDVRSSQTVTNSASKASFPITGTATVGGAFLASAASGTSGTLLCAAAFSGGDRSVISGDTVEVTYTFSAADDGA